MSEKTVKASAEATETKSPTMKLLKKKAAPKEAPVVEEATKAPETVNTEAANVEEGQTMQTETTDLIVKTVHEVENMKEDRAFKLVPHLLDNIDHDYFKLGGVLSVIQANGWFQDRGFETFRAYVEGEGGIMYRKAMYLIGIYNGLVASGVKWDQVKHLGWTKLVELTPHLTPENVDEWVGVAEGMTVAQLQDYIKAKTAAAATGGDAPAVDESKKTTTMTFKVHADQKATIREALDKAKHESGTEVDSVALEFIALDYLGSSSKLSAIPSLKELMAGKSAEEVLGVFGEVFPDVTLEATLPE